jgi:hypothetical protein
VGRGSKLFYLFQKILLAFYRYLNYPCVQCEQGNRPIGIYDRGGDFILAQIIIVIGGLIISAIVGYLVSSRESTAITIRDACLSAAFGTVLLMTIQLQYELVMLRNLRGEIVRPNALHRLETVLENSSSDTPMLKAMMAHKDRMEKELSDIVRGRIELGDQEAVIEEWTRAFSEAATSVYATNFVSPAFWLGGSEFSARQFQIQNSARDRGVTIQRIFIYVGNSDEELRQIKKLTEQQRSIGIEVRFLSYAKLISSPPFIKYSPVLTGAIDFVIYDLNVVLLTFPNPGSRQIEWGVISKERPIVDGATDLFKKLWSISDQTLF